MCGIFGLFVSPRAGLTADAIEDCVETLARLSESRGKDSAGLVLRDQESRELRVFKGALPLASLLKNRDVRKALDSQLQRVRTHSDTFAAMGHSRLVTNGTQINQDNNQPVVKDGVIAVHNGIIVNDAQLWSSHPDIERTCEIDTEVMVALVSAKLRSGTEFGAAVSEAVNEVFGTVAAAFFTKDLNASAVATNNGSLYVLTNHSNFFAFASEGYFVRQLAERMKLMPERGYGIRQVAPGTGFVLDLDTFALRQLPSDRSAIKTDRLNGKAPYDIVVSPISDGKPQRELVLDPAKIAIHAKASSEAKLLEWNIDRIRALRRCVRCILPETFPFLTFDATGVCSCCQNYQLKNTPKPIEELFALVEPYRRSGGVPDCIIPYSGGRDSTHTLHIVKNVLGLHPIAFTYDWGMVNDLARRNIARVCGKLGVENIIVSADIAWKRENIRRNVEAWLRAPNLGMVPLFMAGDKYFFYYCDRLKRQTGIPLNIWGINPLENTDFKVGFLDVSPDYDKKRIYSLSATRQARLAVTMAKNVVSNPRYLNRSVLDTIGSFISRSVVPHRDYYHMYDFYRWDEAEVDDLVLGEYQWEKAIDTNTTWRIGDGTAPFYNYIYYTVAGFSEYDTFRSNQIREGMMTRERALELVEEENRPRYPSIRWYTDIVHLDYARTVTRINAMPKLYL